MPNDFSVKQLASQTSCQDMDGICVHNVNLILPDEFPDCKDTRQKPNNKTQEKK
jgi:hypothetical protein